MFFHIFQAHSVCSSHTALHVSSEIIAISASAFTLEARAFLSMDIEHSSFSVDETRSRISEVSFPAQKAGSCLEIVVFFRLQAAASSGVHCITKSIF